MNRRNFLGALAATAQYQLSTVGADPYTLDKIQSLAAINRPSTVLTRDDLIRGDLETGYGALTQERGLFDDLFMIRHLTEKQKWAPPVPGAPRLEMKRLSSFQPNLPTQKCRLAIGLTLAGFPREILES